MIDVLCSRFVLPEKRCSPTEGKYRNIQKEFGQSSLPDNKIFTYSAHNAGMNPHQQSQHIHRMIGAFCAVLLFGGAILFRLSSCIGKPSDASFKTQENISADAMPEDGIPYLFQFDEPWKNIPYGDAQMEQTGCGPTSLAMVLSFLTGQNFSPADIASWAQENGYYVEGAGSSWSLFTDYPPLWNIEVQTGSDDPDILAAQLAEGGVALLSMGPGDFTSSGHILLAGFSGSPALFNVHDPNSKARSKPWPADVLLSQAAAVFVLRPAS